jgi:hypothetical protein
MKQKTIPFFIVVMAIITFIAIASLVNGRANAPMIVDIVTLRGVVAESSGEDRVFISLRQLSPLLNELNLRLESQENTVIVMENLTAVARDTTLIVPDISLLELLRERDLHGEWYGQHNGWLTHITLEETYEFGPFTATLFRGPFLEVDDIVDVVLVGTYELLVHEGLIRFHWRSNNDSYTQLIEDWEIEIDLLWIWITNPQTGQRIIRQRIRN